MISEGSKAELIMELPYGFEPRNHSISVVGRFWEIIHMFNNLLETMSLYEILYKVKWRGVFHRTFSA